MWFADNSEDRSNTASDSANDTSPSNQSTRNQMQQEELLPQYGSNSRDLEQQRQESERPESERSETDRPDTLRINNDNDGQNGASRRSPP